jgi:PhnB protein
MKAINPYINFDGNTEEAFAFYQSVFGGELSIARFKDFQEDMGATGENLEKGTPSRSDLDGVGGK